MGAQVFEATKGFAEHLGKTVSLSLDRPGFIVNRILMPMINEAFFVLMEARTAGLACVKTCQLYRFFLLALCLSRSKLIELPRREPLHKHKTWSITLPHVLVCSTPRAPSDSRLIFDSPARAWRSQALVIRQLGLGIRVIQLPCCNEGQGGGQRRGYEEGLGVG